MESIMALEFSFSYITFVLLGLIYVSMLDASLVKVDLGTSEIKEMSLGINLGETLAKTKYGFLNALIVGFVLSTYSVNNLDFYHIVYTNLLILIYTTIILMKGAGLLYRENLHIVAIIIIMFVMNYVYSTFLFEKNITSGSFAEFVVDAIHVVATLTFLLLLVVRTGIMNKHSKKEN